VVLPPVPVQVRVKVLAVVMELIVWLPEVSLAPDQASVALQLEASVEDQLSRDEPPLATVVGAALSETVGAEDPGGGALFPPVSLVAPVLPQAARPSVQSNARNEPQRLGMVESSRGVDTFGPGAERKVR
jgi:hypothetical protein